ncbi:glycosyltransferase family 4 protein [Leeuwenhoekiella sp. MAR_2009_132]|uniref:glycosyltransferase family 4 protein n=1 Tax=Leeuwenhoekiella sp. MAR_2009_132 TaxID=1392489 RepID=UPI00048E01B4|nr:glycosyltransferase family 4 protein [Leeuwenhoekiella sp. MAR_2009_132]
MKKALIICYYWPPAGGPGVQRWLKFVKYLRDFDIEPVVYVPENPHYPIVDASLEAEIPQGITVLKHPIKEPYGLAQLFSKKQTDQISSGIIKDKEKQGLLQRLMLFVRGNLFIPDARKWWIKPSVNYLLSYLKSTNIDVIITTGPPHSLHLIGLQLKKQTQLPWVADFRDPWTTIGYQKKLKLTQKSRQKHVDLEFEVLNKADHIIVTSPTTKSDFSKTTTTPITCITNGFDTSYNITASLDSKFTLAHIGSLLEDRNPDILWQVLSELKQEHNDFSQDLRIQLTGKVSATVVQNITHYQLSQNLELPGYVSHQEAVSRQQSAQLLLLIEIDSYDTQAIIPGKLFEYLASKRPIIAIGPKDSDIIEILEQAKSGSYFSYGNKVQLKNTILDFYNRYKTGGISQNTSDLTAFTRKELTRQLSEILHQF